MLADNVTPSTCIYGGKKMCATRVINVSQLVYEWSEILSLNKTEKKSERVCVCVCERIKIKKKKKRSTHLIGTE